jgi:hypothetical protein
MTARQKCAAFRSSELRCSDSKSGCCSDETLGQPRARNRIRTRPLITVWVKVQVLRGHQLSPDDLRAFEALVPQVVVEFDLELRDLLDHRIDLGQSTHRPVQHD